MKITYLSNSSIPSRTANSVHVMKMCQAFSENGHQVRLYARPGTSEVPASPHYGVDDSFEIIYSAYPRTPGLCHYLYTQAVKRKVAQGETPDLLYARHIYSLYALRNIGCSLIYEAHTPPANPLQQRMESKLFSHHNFQRLIVISDALRRHYATRYPHLAPGKILVAHDAADPIDINKPFPPDHNWPGRSGIPQIGYTGHLYPGKGMEIIAELADCMPSMDFHVIGGTEQDITRWRERAPHANLHFHGFIPHATLASYYSKLDVMVAPYQDRVAAAGNRGNIAKWMSPLKLFEYMSARKAIVCSDLPVLREIIKDHVTGLMVKADDIGAWEKAIELLASDPGLNKTIASRAYHEFINAHTWNRRAENVISTFS